MTYPSERKCGQYDNMPFFPDYAYRAYGWVAPEGDEDIGSYICFDFIDDHDLTTTMLCKNKHKGILHQYLPRNKGQVGLRGFGGGLAGGIV